jgi:hypothetical protein
VHSGHWSADMPAGVTWIAPRDLRAPVGPLMRVACFVLRLFDGPLSSRAPGRQLGRGA